MIGRTAEITRRLDALNLGAWALTAALNSAWFLLFGYAEAKPLVMAAGFSAIGAAGCWVWLRIGLANRRLFGTPRRVPLIAGMSVGIVALSIAIAVLSAALVRALNMELRAHGQGGDPRLSFVFSVVNHWFMYGWTAPMFGAVSAAMLSMLSLQERERALAEARAEAQAAQLSALRSQVNPHFLFNALNAATSLIGLGRYADANAVLLRLGDFFRASLSAAPATLVPLHEEFDSVGSYLEIEVARFGDHMRLEADLPDDLRTVMVPPLILQPLAENAVRHGVAVADRPVTLRLEAGRTDDNLILTLADDAPAQDGAAASSGLGVGLANVASRLRVQYGDTASLTTHRTTRGFVSRLEFPLSFEVVAL